MTSDTVTVISRGRGLLSGLLRCRPVPHAMMNDPHRVDHGSAIPEQFQLLWSDRLCGMQNVAAARLQQDWIKRAVLGKTFVLRGA
ncbi:hypothetical protein [Bradyrhizobium sp. 2S1]|uniref:hypothetical protein n=1 Tax=Bradyrhizobium sp. 2S1 TaxID=1404429 RepID=UPI001409B0C0|nr:hypothetical protein [Bradyrhizobium sp. 2S1]MCK7672815.1 hypothetical protein [Bradyrhizobium sp. 2S1]